MIMTENKGPHSIIKGRMAGRKGKQLAVGPDSQAPVEFKPYDPSLRAKS